VLLVCGTLADNSAGRLQGFRLAGSDFWLSAIPVVGCWLLSLGATPSALGQYHSENRIPSFSSWVPLAETAGFCEELVLPWILDDKFGKLDRQSNIRCPSCKKGWSLVSPTVLHEDHGRRHDSRVWLLGLLSPLAEEVSVRGKLLAHGLQKISIGGMVASSKGEPGCRRNPSEPNPGGRQ